VLQRASGKGSSGDADIYLHLGVTLLETVLAFGIGTVLGLAGGLWLALAPTASAILDPYIKAANSMPRVILAPIFALWFGLGIWSKVALAVTLVFFIVFFNVYQGVREVSPVVLANARMLGANQRSCCAPCTCPVPRAGCSPACTPRWAWPSWARWWASTWARRAAWAT
jgi:ABC-type nitrate/sulfonate/bicarbonate transport system permease component